MTTTKPTTLLPADATGDLRLFFLQKPTGSSKSGASFLSSFASGLAPPVEVRTVLFGCTRDTQSETAAVSFNEWKAVLAGSGFSAEVRAKMQRAILGFLHFCKGKGAPASVMLAKLYIDQEEGQAGRRRSDGAA